MSNNGKLAAEIELGPPGGFKGQGPLGLEGQLASDAPSLFNNVISTTIGVMTAVGFIWFIIQIFIGATAIIGAGGDKQKMEEARQKITNGIIGIVVVVAAVFLIDLVGGLLGIDILGGVNVIPELGQ